MQIEPRQRWADTQYAGRWLIVVGFTENRRYVECHVFERGRDTKQRVLVGVDRFGSAYAFESSNNVVPPVPATPLARALYRRSRATRRKSA